MSLEAVTTFPLLPEVHAGEMSKLHPWSLAQQLVNGCAVFHIATLLCSAGCRRFGGEQCKRDSTFSSD